MKLSPVQTQIIKTLQGGAIIGYFRGIGTRYSKSASLETIEGIQIEKISVATLKSLRHKGLLEEYEREAFHSKFKLINCKLP